MKAGPFDIESSTACQLVKMPGKKRAEKVEKPIDVVQVESAVLTPVVAVQPRAPSSKWKTPAIVLIVILIGSVFCLAHYYSSLWPMECYQCSWISHPNGPPLNSDSCGQDQRSVLGSKVKTCAADQSYCGALHISFSYESSGRAQQLEYAFVRDCFSDYPLPYVIQLGKDNRTYKGSREGMVYPNVAGSALNLTVVGQQCSSWSRCNSNVPREGWGSAFLDSINIVQQAKIKGLSVWQSLLDFVHLNSTIAAFK